MTDIVYNKNGIAFDIDAIATDLNGKADIDFTNVNNAGLIKGAGLGMPSNTYKDLTVGASGATYTAPANGWFCVKCKIENQTGSYQSSVTTSYGGSQPLTSYGWCSGGGATVPMLKGQTLNFYYEGNTSGRSIRFVYAQGSESEAS
jgi:hypothetical protein